MIGIGIGIGIGIRTCRACRLPAGHQCFHCHFLSHHHPSTRFERFNCTSVGFTGPPASLGSTLMIMIRTTHTIHNNTHMPTPSNPPNHQKRTLQPLGDSPLPPAVLLLVHHMSPLAQEQQQDPSHPILSISSVFMRPPRLVSTPVMSHHVQATFLPTALHLLLSPSPSQLIQSLLWLPHHHHSLSLSPRSRSRSHPFVSTCSRLA